MPDGYKKCADSECRDPVNRDDLVWCLGSAKCKDPCSCHLFRQLKPKKGDDPDDDKFQPKHFRDPGKKGEYEPDTYNYFCWCVEKEKKEDGEGLPWLILGLLALLCIGLYMRAQLQDK